MKIETAITYLNGLLGSGYPKQDKAVQMAIKALEKENNMDKLIEPNTEEFMKEVCESFIEDVESVYDLLPENGESEIDYYNRLLR